MITLSVILSEKCNLNCTYCDVNKASKESIEPSLFISAFKAKRKEFPQEKIRVDFFGGEPLLQFSSIKLIVEAIKNDPNINFFMPTNGLLLTDERIEYLNANDFQVSLSFDGLWQDQNRKQHGGGGTLEKYLQIADQFRLLRNLKCHSMIYRNNSNLLENHLFILDNFGLNPELTLIRDVGVWDKNSGQKFNEGFTEITQWYVANIETVDIPNLLLFYLQHFILYHAKNIVVDHCGAGESYFSFSQNDELPCNRFQEMEYIKDIEAFRLMEDCEKCSVKNYCKKGCLFENIKNHGPITDICDMYRHIYTEIAKMVERLKENKRFKELMMREIQDA